MSESEQIIKKVSSQPWSAASFLKEMQASVAQSAMMLFDGGDISADTIPFTEDQWSAMVGVFHHTRKVLKSIEYLDQRQRKLLKGAYADYRQVLIDNLYDIARAEKDGNPYAEGSHTLMRLTEKKLLCTEMVLRSIEQSTKK